MIQARILADARRRIGAVDRNLFGGFIEHLGRCIYGGIFEENSPLSDPNGFRKDVLEALRGILPPVMRWPGGNFVSNYHWKDGVGPREDRPARRDLAWSAAESNRFGTDEYIQFCRALGTEPYIAVNLGTGTAEEAADWVEYCNSGQPTSIVQWRKENGWPKPHAVKYWGLGNEMDGPWQVGHCDAAEYARRAREAAKQMRRVDSTIQIVACGAVGPTVSHFDWNLEVLRALYENIDYISLHMYFGDPDYYAQASEGVRIAKEIALARAAIDAVQIERHGKRPIKIAFDEWNVWHRTRGDNALEEQYTLRDALTVGSFLNATLRNCDLITMANLAQMVNVIAPIFTRPEGLFLQTIYYPIQLTMGEAGNAALDILVESPTFQSRYARPHGPADPLLQSPPVGYLDAAATIHDDQGDVVFHLVNLHRDEEMEVEIELAGARKRHDSAETWIITHDDPEARNSFKAPHEVGIAKARPRKVKDGKVTIALPPHSVGAVRLA